MTHTLTDLEDAQRYATLAARLLEKAAEAQQLGLGHMVENRVENAKSFLAKATKVLVEGPAIQELFAHTTAFTEPWEPRTEHSEETNRWLALEYIRRHRIPKDFCDRHELLDPKTHEECIAQGWLKEGSPGVWTWDFEQMDRDQE
jgi:hypothetical protein